MKKLIVLMALLLAVCGCSRDSGTPAGPKPQPTGPDESVVLSNCVVLQAAVEQFASENNGRYPSNVDTDSTLEGHTLVELLPGGQLADNPFTKEPTVPLNGVASHPGEVGYAPIAESEMNVGYIITGFGAEALVAQLTNVGSPEDAKMIANCFIVRKAAEDYKVEYGMYPWDVDVAYHWDWFTSRMGVHPVDPFTGHACYQVQGTASAPGQIGYVAIYSDGDPVGYAVTAYGTRSIVAALSNLGRSRDEALTVSDCGTLRRALDEWAQRHGGVFPDQIGAVSASVGAGVVNGSAITGRADDYSIKAPSGDVSFAAGESPRIVYQVVRREGWNIGYMISGYAGGMRLVAVTNLDPQENAILRLNALRLKKAVEEFAARSGGRYPEDVDSDRTPDGKRLMDFLPNGGRLMNPFTGKWAPPANYTASSRGEIGYAVVHPIVDPPYGSEPLGAGYVITGQGKIWMELAVTNLDFSLAEACVLSNCRTVQLAADRFAALNDGIYPSDVDCSVTKDGRTLRNLLPQDRYLMNPFTYCQTEPVDGWGACQGQTGYTPVCCNSENRGCTITGVGRVNGTGIITICYDTCPTRVEP